MSIKTRELTKTSMLFLFYISAKFLKHSLMITSDLPFDTIILFIFLPFVPFRYVVSLYLIDFANFAFIYFRIFEAWPLLMDSFKGIIDDKIFEIPKESFIIMGLEYMLIIHIIVLYQLHGLRKRIARAIGLIRGDRS